MKRLVMSASVFLLVAFAACNQPTAKSNNEMHSISSVVSLDEAKSLLDSGKVVPLDVRTPEEIENGKINKAIEINYRSSDFKTQLEKLDKSQPYLIYCKSGGRSAKSAKTMKKLGFEKTYDLAGGYTAWSTNK